MLLVTGSFSLTLRRALRFYSMFTVMVQTFLSVCFLSLPPDQFTIVLILADDLIFIWSWKHLTVSRSRPNSAADVLCDLGKYLNLIEDEFCVSEVNLVSGFSVSTCMVFQQRRLSLQNGSKIIGNVMWSCLPHSQCGIKGGISTLRSGASSWPLPTEARYRTDSCCLLWSKAEEELCWEWRSMEGRGQRALWSQPDLREPSGLSGCLCTRNLPLCLKCCKKSWSHTHLDFRWSICI